MWRYGKTRKTKQGRRPRPQEEQIAVNVPPIVSRETWEAVQARLRENQNRSDTRQKNQYLVGGRATCGDCGLKMLGNANGRAGARGTLTYYICAARSRKLELARKCNSPTFRADEVDAGVWEWVKSFLTDPEALARGLWEVHQEREQLNAPIRDRLAVVDDLLGENRAQLERLLDSTSRVSFPRTY